MIRFVFGSNLAGIHGAGAAKVAREKFDAVNGVGRGETGSAYAIPTKDLELHTLHLSDIEDFIVEFLDHSKENLDKLFYLTPIGTGLAGYSHEEIKNLFVGHNKTWRDNVIFPKVWPEYHAIRNGRILVYGGRDWCYKKEPPDYLPKLDIKKFYQSCMIVEKFSKMMYKETIMITGCAKGADEIPIEMNKKFPDTFSEPLKFKPDWKNLGKKAGPIRNQQMIDEGRPTFAIGFPGGTGTDDMTNRLIKSKIPYFRMHDDNEFYETLTDLENIQIGE